MSNTKFYIESSSYGRYPNLDFIHKVNKEYDICVHSDYTWKPCIWASIARLSPVDDTVPKSEDGYKIKRISEEQFNEYFNANYDELQGMNVKSGDYFLERNKNDNSFAFHAFFQKPSKHIKKGYNCYLLDLQDSRKCIYFPGGKMEPGETPEAALVREIREELPADEELLPLIEAGFAKLAQ